MNSNLTNRTRIGHFHINLTPEVIESLVGKNRELINQYAEAYLAGENDHSSLFDYCEKVAGEMKGLAPIPEIKRELRNEIRKQERLGRGGY